MKFKTILNISVVTTSAALAWIYITYSNLLSRIYYDTAPFSYIAITLYVIMAVISAVLFLWEILGRKLNYKKEVKQDGRNKRI